MNPSKIRIPGWNHVTKINSFVTYIRNIFMEANIKVMVLVNSFWIYTNQFIVLLCGLVLLLKVLLQVLIILASILVLVLVYRNSISTPAKNNNRSKNKLRWIQWHFCYCYYHYIRWKLAFDFVLHLFLFLLLLIILIKRIIIIKGWH